MIRLNPREVTGAGCALAGIVALFLVAVGYFGNLVDVVYMFADDGFAFDEMTPYDITSAIGVIPPLAILGAGCFWVSFFG